MDHDERISFGFADVGDIMLHYATAGTGEKLVILLHGFPEFWYSWRDQLVALGEDYTVVAPDLRGFNLSDKPTHTSDYILDVVADDIAGLIRHFGREQAAVIGHDWGASVAWNFAIRRPEMLWKLGALQVPPAQIWKRNQTGAQYLASWYMFFFQLPGLPEFALSRNNYEALERSLTASVTGPNAFTAEDIEQYRAAWSQPGAVKGMLAYYRANFIKRIFAKKGSSKKISVPTLFIYGEKDRAVLPQTVAGVGDMIDGPFTEHRIPDSSHWVQQHAGDEVTDIIRGFLRG